MRTKFTSFVVVLSLGAASAAAAQTYASEAPRQEAVRYQELDLVGASGVNVLQARIDGAARRVCGPEPYALELKRHKEYADCVTAARMSAAEPMSMAVAKARSDATILARK